MIHKLNKKEMKVVELRGFAYEADHTPGILITAPPNYAFGIAEHGAVVLYKQKREVRYNVVFVDGRPCVRTGMTGTGPEVYLDDRVQQAEAATAPAYDGIERPVVWVLSTAHLPEESRDALWEMADVTKPGPDSLMVYIHAGDHKRGVDAVRVAPTATIVELNKQELGELPAGLAEILAALQEEAKDNPHWIVFDGTVPECKRFKIYP